jgi:beta-glucosidase/6-phospho-beta-glucosidase/beta-galactosidase
MSENIGLNLDAASPCNRTQLRPGKMSIGIEGTFEPFSRRDTLSATRHFESGRLAADLDLVKQLGVDEFRYPIPWHRVEGREGMYDWREVDRSVAEAGSRGLTLIADPLHHTSYPAWLRDGFLNEQFVARYVKFVRAFATRHREVTVYAPFNEPTCTLDFSGHRGFWHPYCRGDYTYALMLRNTARAFAEIVHFLRAENTKTYILQVDTFEHHAALDVGSQKRATFLNERRFLFDELLLGRVDRDHPLYRYLRRHGFPAKDLAWHLANPISIDERGGNYYPLNEEQLRRGLTHRAPSLEPRGFAEVARDYAARLPCPLSLTETNIQGTVRDRISWLKYMLEQSEKLIASGIPLRRFAWYPLFDCCGWNSLLQGPRWKRDPQGIFSCDRGWSRQSTELSALYASLSAGKTSADIPAYRFASRHDRTLRGLLTQMKWDWIDQSSPCDRAVGESEHDRVADWTGQGAGRSRRPCSVASSKLGG